MLEPCVRRVIYLDSNLVVVDDVAKLWRTSLGSRTLGAPEYCHANFTCKYFIAAVDGGSEGRRGGPDLRAGLAAAVPLVVRRTHGADRAQMEPDGQPSSPLERQRQALGPMELDALWCVEGRRRRRIRREDGRSRKKNTMATLSKASASYSIKNKNKITMPTLFKSVGVVIFVGLRKNYDADAF